jgi:hypothetical protein
VFRVKGQEREPGHLKNLYCPHCRKECNSAECKDGGKYTYYDFKLEFEYGNFTETGLRKMPYTQFIADLINKGVVDT